MIKLLVSKYRTHRLIQRRNKVAAQIAKGERIIEDLRNGDMPAIKSIVLIERIEQLNLIMSNTVALADEELLSKGIKLC